MKTRNIGFIVVIFSLLVFTSFAGVANVQASAVTYQVNIHVTRAEVWNDGDNWIFDDVGELYIKDPSGVQTDLMSYQSNPTYNTIDFTDVVYHVEYSSLSNQRLYFELHDRADFLDPNGDNILWKGYIQIISEGQISSAWSIAAASGNVNVGTFTKIYTQQAELGFGHYNELEFSISITSSGGGGGGVPL